MAAEGPISVLEERSGIPLVRSKKGQRMGSSRSALDLDELARQTEADAEAAEAGAVAARARVEALRRSRDGGDALESAAGEDSPSPRTGPRWRRSRLVTALMSIARMATCALVATGGYLVWHHQQVVNEQQRRAEFAAGQDKPSSP